MLLKTDCRETDLIQILTKDIEKFPNCKLEICSLPLGDIIICDDTGNELIIIERKTLNDLASSIKDGRYSEQSFRLMNASIHNHNIFYLIEGNLHSYKTSRNITKETLVSATTSLSYTKGFSLYRSLDTCESALWILQTADKLSRMKEPCYYANVHSPCDYNSVTKRVKKNNITQENIHAIMLAQIPNVSTISAAAIMQEYKTMERLIAVLKTDPKGLSNITTANSRKLSKLCIHNIYSFLVG